MHMCMPSLDPSGCLGFEVYMREYASHHSFLAPRKGLFLPYTLGYLISPPSRFRSPLPLPLGASPPLSGCPFRPTLFLRLYLSFFCFASRGISSFHDLLRLPIASPPSALSLAFPTFGLTGAQNTFPPRPLFPKLSSAAPQLLPSSSLTPSQLLLSCSSAPFQLNSSASPQLLLRSSSPPPQLLLRSCPAPS